MVTFKKTNELDGLTAPFTKGDEVLIVCSRKDIEKIFSKLNFKKNTSYGKFKNSNNLNCRSVNNKGVTLHFIDEHLTVDLAKNILKI